MTSVTITIEDVASTDATKHIKSIVVAGQLDESNVDEKAQEIYAVITQNPQNLFVIFDFEQLEYMNSKSIGYLTDWFGKVTEGGGKIMIIKAKPNIVDILQVIGLTQLIPMYATLEEAKFAIQNTSSAQPATPATPSPVAAPTPAPTQTPTPAPVSVQSTQPVPVVPAEQPQPTQPTTPPPETQSVAPTEAQTQSTPVATEPAPVIQAPAPISQPPANAPAPTPTSTQPSA